MAHALSGRISHLWFDEEGGGSSKSGGEVAKFRFRAIAQGISEIRMNGRFFGEDTSEIFPEINSGIIRVSNIENIEEESGMENSVNEEPVDNVTVSEGDVMWRHQEHFEREGESFVDELDELADGGIDIEGDIITENGYIRYEEKRSNLKPALIIGGVALLGLALYTWKKKK